MCWVMPPASPDWTFAAQIRSSTLVVPWSTWPMTVTTGGFSSRSAGSSSGRTSSGAGSSTAPISTFTPSSSAISSTSSMESVCVRVFISPRPMRTWMILVGGTPRPSPRSLTVAPGSTRTPASAAASVSAPGATSCSRGPTGAAVGRAARVPAPPAAGGRRRRLVPGGRGGGGGGTGPAVPGGRVDDDPAPLLLVAALLHVGDGLLGRGLLYGRPVPGLLRGPAGPGGLGVLGGRAA